MNISFTTIIVNEVQISIKLELRGKKIKTNIINEKKILIIGYGSMGKKYEKILSKKFEIKFFDKKKIKKKK